MLRSAVVASDRLAVVLYPGDDFGSSLPMNLILRIAGGNALVVVLRQPPEHREENR